MSLHGYYSQQSNRQNENNHKFDEENAYRGLAKFTCQVEVSPRSYMTGSFKEFMKALNPQLHIKFACVERYCLDVYKEEKILVKQLLESFDGQISLSLDVTRHDGTHGRNIFFVMSLRAHFINADWDLKNWVISYFEPKLYDKNGLFDENACSKTYMKVSSEFNICNKLSTLTLGDVDDNDTVTEFIRDRIGRKKQTKELIFCVHCCADTFLHMVNYAFGKIDDNIDTVRRLASPGKSPPMWHIIIDDLQRVVEMELKGEHTNNDNYSYLDMPPESEWKKIKVVTKLVSFIYNVAEPLFETKNPTDSMYLHNIWELKSSLAKETNSADEFSKETALEMLKTLNKCWKDMFLFLAVVTVMDPWCRMKYIKFFARENENNDDNLRHAHALETIEGLFKSYATSHFESKNTRRDLPTSDASKNSCIQGNKER